VTEGRSPSQPESARYKGSPCNERKEVIQCLIVFRRGRRHPWAGSPPLPRCAPSDV